MSDMKCPFCNGELVGTIGHPICRNQNCVMCDDPMPQELLELLERTRKALDVAVDKLKRIQKIYTNAPFNAPINYANVCTDMYDVATEQITTILENKNGNC